MIEAAAALWTLLVFTIAYGVCWWLHVRPLTRDLRGEELISRRLVYENRFLWTCLAAFERPRDAKGRFAPKSQPVSDFQSNPYADTIPAPSERRVALIGTLSILSWAALVCLGLGIAHAISSPHGVG